MDIYDEKEHLISSDEYTDDDDDNALMNDAVRAQDHFHASFRNFNHQNKLSKFKSDDKQKVLSSLIRKNKISIIYKNKSIKWLNSRKQRERYKELIYQNKRKKNELLKEAVNEHTKANTKVEIDTFLVQNAVSFASNDADAITNTQNNQTEVLKVPVKTNTNLEQKSTETLQDNVDGREYKEKLDESNYRLKKENVIPEKRNRSLTPEILNESNELNLKRNEKRSRIESPQFYKSINEMFPKFDSIVNAHIDTITNSTLASMEAKLKSLASEINTLSEILKTKEIEWNRLLHLKTVKEEIYARLYQKSHNLQIKDKIVTNRDLEDLKELEFYLSKKETVSPDITVSTTTTKKLIEKRANMNTEDLEREKNNTSRLHNLLVSSNVLHGKESSQSILSVANGKRTYTTDKCSELLKKFEENTIVPKKGRQGEYSDIKSIFADFKQNNIEILPRAGKQINLSNSSLHHKNRKFSSSQYLHICRQSDSYPNRNSVEEITISPIGNTTKLSSTHDNETVQIRNNQNRGKTDLKNKITKNIQYPLCQECKTNESRFVCAGCGNQWYCSKKCQVSAWDKHSELCTE